MNLMAGNRDTISFDHPDEFIPKRWLNGCKGRTDLPGEGGEKLGVTHLTYGCGRRWPIAVSTQHSPFSCTSSPGSASPLGEEEKKHVFPPFRAERECSLEMDAIKDIATPTEAQAIIPWSAGIKFHCRDPEGLRAWVDAEET